MDVAHTIVLALASTPLLAQDAAVATAARSLASAVDAAATVDDAGANAFGFPSPLLHPEDRRAFAVGNALFRTNWVAAPSSTSGVDGLGPLFNARSCSSCHVHDGRSRPPYDGEAEQPGLLLRIGRHDRDGPDRPHPVYGDQLQQDAIQGVRPEVRVQISWRAIAGSYADGTAFELLAPEYELREPAYGPLGDDVTLGGRVAPQLIGMGLLEAVPAASLFALADPDDRDGDGVSGRVHVLAGAGNDVVVGRFGWKATQPSVRAQTAAAFVNDMGITSAEQPREPLGDAERAAITSVSGGDPEIDAHKLDRVVFYVQSLAVPAPRGTDDAAVGAGRQHFAEFGCAACHVAQLRSGPIAFHPAFANRTFAPFTDLLLHDLGSGLSDGKRDGDARPGEWRTPPLWGIGLFAAVNGHERYLHDGRARGLAEAVLWHGGEAEPARERFRTAPARARSELLAFLQSR